MRLLFHFSFVEVVSFVKKKLVEHDKILNWEQKKVFFVNVFWSNISSWNCFHKQDIYNFIYMIFSMEKTF